MGMAALALTTLRTERGASVADLERMGIWRLREIARQTHPEHVDEAAGVYVARLLEMAAEWLTDYRHANPGYQPFSSVATMGEQPGGSTRAAEPLLMACLRAERARAHHLGALAQIDAAVRRSQVEEAFRHYSISQRQLIAVLIQARKLHPRRAGSDWTASYDQIAANLGRYVQQLGWPPTVADGLFKDGRAITNAAALARASLILQAKAGVL